MGNDHRGVLAARDYGKSYVVLKQVRLRCTMTHADSGRPDVTNEHVGTLDKCAHVLMNFTDEELQEIKKVANAPPDSLDCLGDSKKIDGFNYKELQLHGALSLSTHVDRLVVHPEHLVDGWDKKKIEELCERHCWQFSWMGDDEKDRRVKLHKERARALGEQHDERYKGDTAEIWGERSATLGSGAVTPLPGDAPEGTRIGSPNSDDSRPLLGP